MNHIRILVPRGIESPVSFDMCWKFTVMRSYFVELLTALDQIEKFSFVEKIVNFQLFNLFTLDNTFKQNLESNFKH